jgi:hypothetical protein
MVRTRDGVPERGGCAAAGRASNDGARDCRNVGSRKGSSAHPQASHRQAAILTAVRKRNGSAVVGEVTPARWRLAVYMPDR